MTWWHDEVQKDKSKNLPRSQWTRMPSYLAQCVLETANRLTGHPRFYNYTSDYKEVLVDDAITICVAYLHNFDKDKIGRKGEVNPFGYLTETIRRSFMMSLAKLMKIERSKLMDIVHHDGVLACSDDSDYDHTDIANIEVVTQAMTRIAEIDEQLSKYASNSKKNEEDVFDPFEEFYMEGE